MELGAQAVRSLRNLKGIHINKLLEVSLVNDPADNVKRQALDMLLDHRCISHFIAIRINADAQHLC